MTKEQLFGLIRAAFTLLGSYLLGHNLFGNVINDSLWQEITGGALVVAAFIWTGLSKELTLEFFQSSILKIVMIVGTLFVASGRLTDKTLQGIVGMVTMCAPIIYSLLSKEKNKQLQQGNIDAKQLSK